MRVVFRFGVYIVTKSVMGLWWFRWIVFSLSCIGLATSLTSSKSFCINYFYFRIKLCCCDFCKCFYKITSKSFLFTSDSTHEYGDKMPTHETACCITIAFWETRKIVGTWFEIILSAMWIAKPWGTFCGFLLVRFLCGLFPNVRFSRDFLFCPAWHSLFSCCRFFSPICAHFLLFSIGLICFMAIQNISNPEIVFTWGSI